MIRRLLYNAWAIGVLATAIPPMFAQSPVSDVDAVLNDLHDAAAKGDFKRYFSHFVEGAVFLGTDPSERWSLSQFQAYARDKSGWKYVPKQRFVFLSADKTVAWFDERLDSPKYHDMRGTGVLVKSGKTWKLAQYSLSKPIPNGLFPRVVDLIEAQQGTQSSGQKAPGVRQ
jgi:SnoaL-like domain